MPSILFHKGFGQYNPGLVNVSECHGCCSGFVARSRIHSRTANRGVSIPLCVAAVGTKGWILAHFRPLERISILFDNPNVTPKPVSFVNLVSLLPLPFGWPLGPGSCIIVCRLLSSCLGLINDSLGNVDVENFSDGSSFMDHRNWKSRYTVITLQEILWMEALPSHTWPKTLNYCSHLTFLSLWV